MVVRVCVCVCLSHASCLSRFIPPHLLHPFRLFTHHHQIHLPLVHTQTHTHTQQQQPPKPKNMRRFLLLSFLFLLPLYVKGQASFAEDVWENEEDIPPLGYDTAGGCVCGCGCVCMWLDTAWGERVMGSVYVCLSVCSSLHEKRQGQAHLIIYIYTHTHTQETLSSLK